MSYQQQPIFVKNVYLFLGQDTPAKAVLLNRLKEKLLSQQTKEFNQDTLYAKEISLKQLQETFLFLPLKSGKRLVVIKNVQDLKDEARAFLIKYIKNPAPQVILVLDIEKAKPKDEFVEEVKRFSQVCHFSEEKSVDAFALGRQIALKKTALSLQILNHLFKQGEKPEKILGGMRASLLRNTTNLAEARKRIKLLLQCDLDIKTGKIKPSFALEKLIINLTCNL